MPVWHMTIDVSDLHGKYRDEEMAPHEIAQEFAKRIRAAPRHHLVPSDELIDIAEMFEAIDEFDDVEDLDDALEELYDWADERRVWINSFASLKKA